MTSTFSPSGLIAASASMANNLSKHFSSRPSLRRVACDLLLERWGQRFPAVAQTPDQLYLITPIAVSDPDSQAIEGYDCVALPDLVIRRYCLDRTLNLTPEVQFLSAEAGAEFPRQLVVDLHVLEQLVNELGADLLERYCSRLVDYWALAKAGSVSPWQWLVTHLQAQLKAAVTARIADHSIDSLEGATALALTAFPEAESRAQLNGGGQTLAYLLSLDPTGALGIDPQLASAIVIERHIEASGRNIILLFTLTGELHRYASREALAQAVAGDLDGALTARDLNLHIPSGNIFQAQARTLLEQQLLCIDNIAGSWQRHSPAQLLPALEQATSLFNTTSLEQQSRLEQLWRALPTWLTQADTDERRQYRDGMLALAQVQSESKGAWVLEDVESIETYAERVLGEQIGKDRIDLGGLALTDIEIVNNQVTAVPMGGVGNVSAVGEVNEVRLSLVRFSLENLAALRPGRVEVSSTSGRVLPGGVTIAYLKKLVQQVDVGGNYPKYLRAVLQADSAQVERRQTLFKQHLQVQVPLLALQYSLQGRNRLDDRGWACVNGVFQPPGQRRARGRVVTLARLGFIAQAGEEADSALGAYVIGYAGPADEPVILYRTLHAESLIQFGSRQELLATLKTDTALQADILRRLPEGRRPVYALGGFESPHIVRFGSGSEFAPISTPAPATLSHDTLQGDLTALLYQDVVDELVELAREQSVSTAQSRWESYRQLGWLMFNTLLPFVSGPVATAGWLLQAMASVQGTLQAESAGDKTVQAENLVDLLFNIVLVLSLRRHEVEPAARPASNKVAVLLPKITQQALTSPTGHSLQRLDFSWAASVPVLSTSQTTRLAQLKVQPPAGRLSPVPHGPYKGLIEYDEAWYAQVDLEYYRVALGDGRARIIDIQEQSNPGPWLRSDTQGHWSLDLRLGLRGGGDRPDPTEQARKVNALQRLWSSFDAQKAALQKALGTQLDVLEGMPESEATTDLHEAYAAELEKYMARLSLADDALKKQNALQIIARFQEKHADYSYELGLRSQEQATHLHVLIYEQSNRFLTFADRLKDSLNTLFEASDEEDRRNMFQYFVDGLGLIDRLIVLLERVERLRSELPGLPPSGRKYAAILERTGRDLKSPLTWKVRRLAFLAILAGRNLGKSHEAVELVRNAGKRARLNGQTLLGLERGYSPEQMIEPLQSVIEQFSRAEDNVENIRLNLEAQQRLPELDRLIVCLGELRELAQARLNRAQELLDEALAVPSQSGQRTGKLIRTRHRGLLIGHLRPAGNADESPVVDLVEPLKNEVLATFRQNSGDQVWDEVVPERASGVSAGRSLESIVGDARKWLSGTDRAIENAQLQSRTAKIPVEMEEILQQRATRLLGLADEIETALTRTNDTDRPTLEQGSSVILDHALTTAAERCNREGQRLRIAMTKARPPTDTGVDYLVQHQQVTISAVNGRVPTADKKASDFLQEYVIKDLDGSALWYAHFHYPSRSGAAAGFKVAHLKTADQRRLGFKKQMQDGVPVVPVYRYPISPRLAERLFLGTL